MSVEIKVKVFDYPKRSLTKKREKYRRNYKLPTKPRAKYLRFQEGKDITRRKSNEDS